MANCALLASESSSKDPNNLVVYLLPIDAESQVDILLDLLRHASDQSRQWAEVTERLLFDIGATPLALDQVEVSPTPNLLGPYEHEFNRW